MVGHLMSDESTTPLDPPSFESVTVACERGVATLRVGTGRAENQMTTETYGDLLAAARWAAGEPRVRVIVLIGAGRDFSVGGDHARHRERDVHDFRAHLGLLLELATSLRTNGKPVIAAVRGRCTGGMNQVALIADLTIASETARFGQHGSRLGSMPSLWGTQLLPLAVGEKRAREIVFMCWEYTAHEAREMGLANRVVPDAELEAEVRRWTDRLLEMSPRSLRMAKTSMNFGSDLRSAGVWHGREILAEFAGTPEQREAVDSYLENRLPSWAVED
jgi:enoyl-CoA hydratase/carnithine racemase